MQTTIFDMLYPRYYIKKPIRLIEFFSGYGSQALALKYLGVEFTHYKTCEWAVKSIQAYKDIHFTDDNKDYSQGISKEQLIERLHYFGISNNYNDPMTLEQIKRLNEDNLRTIFNNIVATNNLVNIQNVKGADLEIVDTDKYDYILTYSFPCQDLSLAGKGAGMSDTSTRSGMLWEVERILKECKELGELPEILLMENVPQVHGTDNVEDFNKWQLELEKLGYKNYFQDLIATDYGIPQTRNRCFMISILGDYSYTFPQPIPLNLKLKDMLESNVDEKYYLSDKMLNYMLGVNQKESKYNRREVFQRNFNSNKKVASTITTNAGNRATDNFITIKKDTENYIEWEDGKNIQMNCRAWKDDKVIATLNTGGETKILENKNMKEQLCNDLIKQGKVKENDVIRHSYTTSRKNGDMKDLKQNNISPTLDTRCDCLGVCVGTYQYSKSDNFMQGKDRLQLGKEVSDTLQTTPKEGIVNNDLRIRKLTPKECFRLMGVKDEDFEKARKNQSDSSLYHLAGDSIVVDVLMAIFKELF